MHDSPSIHGGRCIILFDAPECLQTKALKNLGQLEKSVEFPLEVGVVIQDCADGENEISK